MNNTTASQTKVLNEKEEYRELAYLRILSRMPKYLVNTAILTRSLVYISHLSEGISKLFPTFTRPLYALSLGYVITDIGTKCYEERDKGDRYRKILLCDLIIWHSAASFIFPAIVVRTFLYFGSLFLSKISVNEKARLLFPAALVLISIPLLIKPIDNFTDSIMDSSFRIKYNYKSLENTLEPNILINKVSDNERLQLLKENL